MASAIAFGCSGAMVWPAFGSTTTVTRSPGMDLRTRENRRGAIASFSSCKSGIGTVSAAK